MVVGNQDPPRRPDREVCGAPEFAFGLAFLAEGPQELTRRVEHLDACVPVICHVDSPALDHNPIRAHELSLLAPLLPPLHQELARAAELLDPVAPGHIDVALTVRRDVVQPPEFVIFEPTLSPRAQKLAASREDLDPGVHRVRHKDFPRVERHGVGQEELSVPRALPPPCSVESVPNLRGTVTHDGHRVTRPAGQSGLVPRRRRGPGSHADGKRALPSDVADADRTLPVAMACHRDGPVGRPRPHQIHVVPHKSDPARSRVGHHEVDRRAVRGG